MTTAFKWNLDKQMGEKSFNTNENPNNRHRGQRKLLIGEIEFLSEIQQQYPGGARILSIGSSPGHHLPWLQTLFPNFTWDLWDPHKMVKNIDLDWTHTQVNHAYFTDEIAKNYSPKPDIVISDIRRDGKSGTRTFEKSVLEDLKMQARWIELLGFPASWIKFRLPYNLDSDGYYFWHGQIRFQCWEKETSGETRMFVPSGKQYSQKFINFQDYERKMFYFNTVYRPNSFWDIEPFWGINYDYTNEIQVWRKYLLNGNRPITDENIFTLIKKTDIMFQDHMIKDNRNDIYKYSIFDNLMKIANERKQKLSNKIAEIPKEKRERMTDKEFEKYSLNRIAQIIPSFGKKIFIFIDDVGSIKTNLNYSHINQYRQEYDVLITQENNQQLVEEGWKQNYFVIGYSQKDKKSVRNILMLERMRPDMLLVMTNKTPSENALGLMRYAKKLDCQFYKMNKFYDIN